MPEIVFDPIFLDRFSANPLQVMWEIFSVWGWLILLFPMCWMAWMAWTLYRTVKHQMSWKWKLLAINIPRENEQSPLAVEQVFAQLAGAHATFDVWETNFLGYIQPWFSFEVVSIEGFTQFLIYCVDKFRNNVEAAVYAQYPDAEITEVEDYTKGFPSTYPHKEYDVWGSEFILVKDDCYPIRTYPEFEHTMSQELKDPMAAFLESLSRLGTGEQAWVQLLVKPIGPEWKEAGIKLVKKLIGAPPEKSKPSLIDLALDVPLKSIEAIGSMVLTPPEDAKKEKKHEAPPSQILFLSPGERGVVEGIERKLSKIGFECKMRVVYLAKKDVFAKARIMYGLIGAIKQFNTENLNSLKPDYKRTGVSTHYFFTERRKNWRKSRLMRAYRARSMWRGARNFILNIEELASLWHFPVLTVRAPLLHKTEAKRAEPPATLPTERTFSIKPVTPTGASGGAPYGGPPPNLPTA